MPSNSLIRWKSEQAVKLDEIENAHALVGGSEPGRRYATQQINFAYAALLCSHFQGFCRDLHSECIDHFIARVPLELKIFTRDAFLANRKLDRGNPNCGNLGSDFKRFGVDLWEDVKALHVHGKRRMQLLDELVRWRNAIAHQDFEDVATGGTASLHLVKVRDWRRATDALAGAFDRVMYNYLTRLLNQPPW